MAYCTHSDLEARLAARKIIQCLDEERTATAATTLAAAKSANAAIGTRLDACIADADARIDMGLRGRYNVPLDPVPDSVRKISVDLSLFYIHGFRGSEFEPPAAIDARYRDALRRIEDVSQAGLDVGTNKPPAAGTKPAAKLHQAEARFTSSTLEDM